MIAVLTPCLFYAILVRVLNCVSKSARENCVRPPNTVFARDLADAIQRAHKDCKNKHAIDTAITLFAQCPLYLCYFTYNTYIALIRMRSKRFTSIVLQYG